MNKTFRGQFNELEGDKIIGKHFPHVITVVIFIFTKIPSVQCAEKIISVHDPDSKPACNAKCVYNLLYSNNNSDNENIKPGGSQKQKRMDDSILSLYSLASIEPHKRLSSYDVAIKKQGVLLISLINNAFFLLR